MIFGVSSIVDNHCVTDVSVPGSVSSVQCGRGTKSTNVPRLPSQSHSFCGTFTIGSYFWQYEKNNYGTNDLDNRFELLRTNTLLPFLENVPGSL